jgi:hypothetical protein
VVEMETAEKTKPRPGPGLRKLARSYAFLSAVSNLAGAIFWWAEQKRWQLADQLEELEWQR